MTSAHPDFGHIAGQSMNDADLLQLMRASPPEPVKTLNGELIDIDQARGTCRFRFEIVPAFCHSDGRVCQGGFLTGMVDTAMANAAIVRGNLAVAVPTLELKISFFEAMGPGIVFAGPGDALGRLGRFPDSDIKDEKAA
jgi:acyl-coenzyme A thioesterase PaaI-like protein